MLLARFEPENNLKMILDGYVMSGTQKKFLVVGNHQNKYGKYLKKRYQNCPNIIFVGAIYELSDLNNLRYFSEIYFHGHSVGGTNPSLLEAMASQALISAHNNEFNKGILKEKAFYFSQANDVSNIIKNSKKNDNLQWIKHNYQTIEKEYNWPKINEQYLQLFEQCMAIGKKRAKD